jgi:hypothetical protein
MPEVLVRARISDEHLREYEGEAQRRGVTVAELVQQTVNCLLAELELEERECREVSTS